MRFHSLYPFLTLAALVLASVPAAADVTGDDHPDPGVSPSFPLFPQHDEVVASVEEHRGHAWFELVQVGASEEGKPILVAAVTNPEGACATGEGACAVTFLFTQQHGNEPAGTPALLALLDEIAAGGDATAWLDNQLLLALPLANPDGAAANQRHNAEDHDINRDHMGLVTAEANALHAVFNGWDVHVALDHHEYSGIGPGVPGAVTLYDADLTTLFPVHGNVRAPTLAAAESLMYDGIWPAAKADGFTVNEYGRVEAGGEVEVQRLAGGPDPGIMRNHLGLHHVAGLLVETRVDAHPNPLHDAERRIAIHDSVMRATLAFVEENAQAFVDAKTESLRDAVASPAKEYVEGETTAALADAYRTGTNVDATFTAHGLPAALDAAGDGHVYLLDHAFRGHAAALLHPQSSRAIVDDAEPAEPGEALVNAGDPVVERSVPGAGALLPLLVVGVLALARARRA